MPVPVIPVEARLQRKDRAVKTRLARVFAMVAILVTPASTTESGEPAKPPPAARRIVAARTTVAPVIDGKLDDACWKEAAQATDFSVFYRPEVLHPVYGPGLRVEPGAGRTLVYPWPPA